VFVLDDPRTNTPPIGDKKGAPGGREGPSGAYVAL